MCGITGFMDLSSRKISNGELIPTVTRTADAIHHRGPDDKGGYLRAMSHWAQPDAVVMGGHETLTILRTPKAWPAIPK